MGIDTIDTVDIKALQALGNEQDVELDLSWLNPGTDGNLDIEPDKHGLTIESLQTSSYGEIPDHTDNYTMLPRGAAARPGATRLGIRWGEKSQSWSEAVSMLYEEAHQLNVLR